MFTADMSTAKIMLSDLHDIRFWLDNTVKEQHSDVISFDKHICILTNVIDVLKLNTYNQILLNKFHTDVSQMKIMQHHLKTLCSWIERDVWNDLLLDRFVAILEFYIDTFEDHIDNIEALKALDDILTTEN